MRSGVTEMNLCHYSGLTPSWGYKDKPSLSFPARLASSEMAETGKLSRQRLSGVKNPLANTLGRA
jgi:hypothetical protein